MIELEINNLFHQIFIVLLIIILLFFGWKIKSLYKNILFLLIKRRGRKAEKYAEKLLISNGYKVLNKQFKLESYLYEEKKKITFTVIPDFLVSKDHINYIAEVKTGYSALVTDRNTRRQLLEYTTIFNVNKALLVDITRKKIKLIEFKINQK